MCINCDEIIQVGNSGTNGWSPILALYEGECDGDAVTVHQLVSWQEGSGTRPLYNGNIMTDQWLIDHPIYLGSAGFVTDICEATNLQPANGANGATGATGEAGPAGENGNDGCNPDISITASVVGGEKTYEVDVIPGGEPCSPTYELEFPIVLFEDTVENLVDTAVNSALTVTPTYILDPSINIGTGDTSDIKYTLLQTISGSPSLNIDATYANWIGYYTVGNQLTMDFRINIAGSGGSGFYRLEMLIPNSYTSFNNNFTSAIGFSYSNGTLTNPSAIITTNSSTGSTHLKFGVALSPYADIKPVLISDSGLLTIIGQITFLID